MKRIALYGGETALIDDCFYEQLSAKKWYINGGYPAAKYKIDGKWKWIKMHHVIIGKEPGKIVDHIDGNKLNAQVSNLRFVSIHDNVHNQKKRVNTKTRFKGVHKKAENFFTARCRMYGKVVFLGNYKTDIAAAHAYNKYALEQDSFAIVNHLPYRKDYLDGLLISDRRTIKPCSVRSVYKNVNYHSGTRSKNKWITQITVNGKRYYKDGFATDELAYKYFIENFAPLRKSVDSLKGVKVN